MRIEKLRERERKIKVNIIIMKRHSKKKKSVIFYFLDGSYIAENTSKLKRKKYIYPTYELGNQRCVMY